MKKILISTMALISFSALATTIPGSGKNLFVAGTFAVSEKWAIDGQVMKPTITSLGTGRYSRELPEIMKRGFKEFTGVDVHLRHSGETNVQATFAETKTRSSNLSLAMAMASLDYEGEILSSAKIECKNKKPVITDSSSFSENDFMTASGAIVVITGEDNQAYIDSESGHTYYFNESIVEINGNKGEVVRNALRVAGAEGGEESEYIIGQSRVEAVCNK